MTAATQLADARRTLGLTLEDIATRTKVGVETLAAIEAVDMRGLPALVYLKGFIRAYAVEVGLDADTTADRYITELPNSVGLASSELSSGIYIIPMEESLEAFESEGPDGDDIEPSLVSHSSVGAPDEAPLRPTNRTRAALAIVMLALVSVLGGIAGFMLSANVGSRGGRPADPDSASAAASSPGSVANATNEPSGRATWAPDSATPGLPPASARATVQSAPPAPPITRKLPPHNSNAARPAPETHNKTAAADSPVPSAVILVPGFPTGPGAATTARAADASDDVSGVWTVTSQVEAAAVAAYKNLLLGFRVELEQRGNRVVGAGHKVTENGAPLPVRRRTPINLEGTLDGNRLALDFTEHGTRRASAGRFVLYLSDDGSFRGRFTSDAAQSSGETIAVREAAARD